MAHPGLPVPPSDEQLLERVFRGERAALNDLFRQHREMAYRVAYRLLGNEEDALDAVQEAFVKVLTHLQGFQRSSFKTWLLRVVSTRPWTGRWRAAATSFIAKSCPRAEPRAVGRRPEPSFELSGPTCGRILTERCRNCPRPSGRRSCCTSRAV